MKTASRANHRPRHTGRNLLAVGLLACATFGNAWATTPIYKCFDRKSDVVYTDEPCKDGAPLDVRAGDADPAAVARLDRARDALDQSAAQRISDMRRIGAPMAYAPPGYGAPGDSGWDDYAAVNSPYDYGAYWGIAGYSNNGRHPHARPRAAFNGRGIAVAPPIMGGRR